MSGAPSEAPAPLQLQRADAAPADVQLLRALAKDREELALRTQLVQDLAEERDRAVEQVTALRSVVEKSTAEVDARENELADLKLTLGRRDTRIGELEERLANAEPPKDSAIAAELDARENELADLKLELGRRDARISGLEERLTGAATPKDTSAAAADELDAKENEVADLKIELGRRDARIAELEQRLSELEKTLAMLAEADEKL